MKKIYLVVFVMLAAISSQAQVPQAFSYQAVIRNSSNALVANQTVSERISLIKDSSTGTVVYSEMQSPKTNANGLVSLQIGTGNVLSGSFSGINWATGTYFIKIETDPIGGNTYSINNTTQLLSVPFALQAGSAPSLQYPDGFANAQTVVVGQNGYTVPSGKNFYIQNAQNSCCSTSGAFKVGSDTFGNLSVTTANFIVGENQTITLLDSSTAAIGFIVNKIVSPIIINLQNGNYTVPNGKQFILYGVGLNNSVVVNPVYINGVGLFPEEVFNYNPYQLLTAGTVISGTAIINGYLR